MQVPGSPSSELQTRYFGPGNWRGMKLHFRPVGKPAPPRPRSPEALTSAITCSGVIALPSAALEDLAQRLVAAARLVVLQAPVAAVEAGVDLRADVAAVKAGLGAVGLELERSSIVRSCDAPPSASVATSSSSRSSLMKLHHLAVVDQHHRRVGAGAQALGLLHGEEAVGRGTVLFDAEPAAQVLAARSAPSRSWHGRLVQTLSLKRPTGCWLYML